MQSRRLCLNLAAPCIVAGMLVFPGRAARSAPGVPPSGGGQEAAPAEPPPASRQAPATPAAAAPQTRETTGPWGVLQAYDVWIAAPDSLLELAPLPSEVTVWNFHGLSADQVAATLDQPGLPPATAEEILDRDRWLTRGDMIQVVPSDAAVLSLPSDVRAAIYNVLARWPDNEFHNSPYFVADGDARAWLAGANLPTRLVDAVARTTYPVGAALCFSDLPLLVSMSPSYREARHVLKALSRTRSTVLRLRVNGPDDVARISDYWGGQAGSAKDFTPLLESLAGNPEVRFLDLAHVLPPTPRRLMYTFPRPEMAVGGRYPDCHWTSLNFFRDPPEPRLIDVTGATSFVLENLHPAEPPFRYGDVIVMLEVGENGIHSCVYLADGYVFTKNGSTVFSPWLIMKLDEVRQRYSRLGPVSLRIYRP